MTGTEIPLGFRGKPIVATDSEPVPLLGIERTATCRQAIRRSVMTSLRPELAEALEALYAGARVESLAGDASTRRFHRLFPAGGGTRIVMDYGKPFDGETDDMRLARIFERAALPVARILDVLPQGGAPF